ncbi:hypothetical protein [Streptomyces sp. NPDC088789]|uniref:hypothetical protein n=1 Tax=Streptomyces sp. NPDC088789 TaxID=3365899 RepID=UPI0037FDF952
MTTLAPAPPQLQQQTDCLRDLAEALRHLSSPARWYLAHICDRLRAADGEILLQRADPRRRALRLTPVPLADAGHHSGQAGELAAVLGRHPIAASWRLVCAVDELAPTAGESLVQTAGTRTLTVRPVPNADLRPGDILHATRTLDPADTAWTDYATTPRNDHYHSHTRPDGSTGHTMAPS